MSVVRPPYAVGERLDCWGPLIDNPEETYKCFNKECLKVNDPAKAKDRKLAESTPTFGRRLQLTTDPVPKSITF